MTATPFTVDEITRATGATHRPPAGSGSGREKGSGGLRVCTSVCTDSRAASDGALFVALVGPRFDGHAFLGDAVAAGASAALVIRGASLDVDAARGIHLFEVDDSLEALGAIARRHRKRSPKVRLAAITGSNGKTTTKEMLAATLAPLGAGLKTKGNLNNRIGVPLTLLQLSEEHRWAVIEMGMNEPGEIAALTAMAKPALGLVTTASAVHLQGLGSVDAVARAKAELYDGLPDGAVAVVNLDDERLPRLAESAGAIEAGGRLHRVTYGLHPRADVRLGEVGVAGDGSLRFQVLVRAEVESTRLATNSAGEELGGVRSKDGTILTVKLPMLGSHNAHNACGALAAAIAMGVPSHAAAEALGGIAPIRRRLEPRPGPRGSLILDDCYNAGPASVLAALETAAGLAKRRGGRLLAVLGDMLELGDQENALHKEMGRAAADAGAELLVAFGSLGALVARAARDAGLEEATQSDDPESVTRLLADFVRPGDVLLIKGSRGLALERVVDPLVASADDEPARGAGRPNDGQEEVR